MRDHRQADQADRHGQQHADCVLVAEVRTVVATVVVRAAAS